MSRRIASDLPVVVIDPLNTAMGLLDTYCDTYQIIKSSAGHYVHYDRLGILQIDNVYCVACHEWVYSVA